MWGSCLRQQLLGGGSSSWLLLCGFLMVSTFLGNKPCRAAALEASLPSRELPWGGVQKSCRKAQEQQEDEDDGHVGPCNHREERECGLVVVGSNK